MLVAQVALCHLFEIKMSVAKNIGTTKTAFHNVLIFHDKALTASNPDKCVKVTKRVWIKCRLRVLFNLTTSLYNCYFQFVLKGLRYRVSPGYVARFG